MFLSFQRTIIAAALVCLASASSHAADASVAELIQASKSGAETSRINAIDQIGARGEKAAEAVPALVQLLSDSSAGIRAHAANALGGIGNAAKPAAAALTSLVKDSDESVRRQAIKALSLIKPGPDVMIPLVTRLLEESDPGVQMRILHAVSEAGQAAVPALVQALANERSAYWACLILREIGPEAKAAVPSLAAKLTDSRPEIRREAALALGTMGEAAAPAAGQIAGLLDDADAAIAATLSLGQIGRLPSGAESKIRANAQRDQKLLGTISLVTLARVHPEDKALGRAAAEQLVGRLKDPDPFVRAGAARGLAALQLGPETMVPIIENALTGADEATIRNGLDALASLGPAAVPRLIDALKYEKLRAAIAYTLGQIGPPAAPATEALAQLLSSNDARVVAEAAYALAKIGPTASASVPALMAALKQPECPKPHAVMYALGKIGSASLAAKPELIRYIGDKDQAVAVMAVWALVQVDPRSPEITAKGLPVLIAGLSHSLPEPRQMAVETLGSLKAAAKDAAPALEKAVKDDNPAVRSAAQEALRALRESR